ncbi:hypothetical protein P7H15_10995 [Paenibacillus larvae]|nr:hypothetical protein [Paenibacillus larvae]MDT2293262.1 hypothetical protein [Paenibacillus larvae]
MNIEKITDVVIVAVIVGFVEMAKGGIGLPVRLAPVLSVHRSRHCLFGSLGS